MALSVLPVCLILLVLITKGEMATTPPPGPDGSPVLHASSLNGGVPPSAQATTTPNTTSASPTTQPPVSSVFGGGGGGGGTQTGSSGPLTVFDSNVPYDLKDPSNPHWTHFLTEVAQQTSRDLTSLQADGVNDPVIGAMWDVYVQTIGDGSGLPSGVGGVSGTDTTAYGSAGSDSAGTGSVGADPMSSGIDANMAPASLYDLWGRTTTPPPNPAINEKWFLNFFKTPTSSSSSTSGSASSSATSSSQGTQTQSDSAPNTVNQQYQSSTYQSPQYPTPKTQTNTMQTFSQFTTYPASQQQNTAMTSYQNTFNTAMMSPMMSSSMRSTSFPTSYQTSAQQTTQQNPLLLIQRLMAPQSTVTATQQQTSGPDFKFSSAPWSSGSLSNQQTYNQQQQQPQLTLQHTQQAPVTVTSTDTSASSSMVADLSRQLLELLGKASPAAPSAASTPAQTSSASSSPSFLSSSIQNLQPPTQTVPPPPESRPMFSLGPSSLGNNGAALDPVNGQVMESSPSLGGGLRAPNAIDSLSNSPGMPPAALNMATGFNPVSFYYNTMFNARASRDLGCRTMGEMLDMDVPRPMDLSCTRLCPAIMPGAVTGKRFGTTCLCCPVYVSDRAIGLRGLMRRNRYVAEGLS